MNARLTLALALDPSLLLRHLGLTPDPWQRDLLRTDDRQLLLNCSRQSGKSTTVATLALHTALFRPNALVLLVSPSQRQSHEIFRKVTSAYHTLGRPVAALSENETRLELANGSRVLGLPCREATIRSYSGVALLVLDEAARVPDDLYRSVRPMLAVSQGRLVALSTPFGQRGWFHDEWVGTGPWKRVCVTWRDCPRITADFIDEERRALGDAWVDQEYNCRFNTREGLVYPDFEASRVEQLPDLDATARRVGGIDFGFRNPFAAVWGVLDRDDVLWLTGERYLRQTTLPEHAAALPPRHTWYADPAGPGEIEQLRLAGHTVFRGNNDLRLGIAAVTARLRTGRLKVHAPACPNLLAEARLYRYASAGERAALGENPVDEHNHALAALRYLVARLDARALARRPTPPATPTPVPARSRDWDDDDG